MNVGEPYDCVHCGVAHLRAPVTRRKACQCRDWWLDRKCVTTCGRYREMTDEQNHRKAQHHADRDYTVRS